jgi:hypothetical protein
MSITVVTDPQMNAMPLRGPRSVASRRLNATRLNGDAAAVNANNNNDKNDALVTTSPVGPRSLEVDRGLDGEDHP